MPVHFKLSVFLGQHMRQQLELFGIDRLLFIRTVQQAAGRELVAARDARHGGLGFLAASGAFRDLWDDRRRLGP